MTKPDKSEATKPNDGLNRLKHAIEAFQNPPDLRAISAMEIVIWYVAKVGYAVHSKRNDEHTFTITREFKDGRVGEEWEEKLLNVYALRDEFLSIKEWSHALEFLGSTGDFYPLSPTITWTEFQIWQRFARIVQEHDRLAATLRSGFLASEHGEVLRALTGRHSTSFFDTPALPESELEAEWRKDPRFAEAIRSGEAHHQRQLRDLCSWFREPPGVACSIQWVPKKPEGDKSIWDKFLKGSALFDQQGRPIVEFLLPQSELQPILFIEPSTTLQAIAAAIYADRVCGIEYRVCEMCNALFKLGAHREKKYCDRERCKNRAHQKNRRANATKKMAGATQTSEAKKGGRK